MRIRPLHKCFLHLKIDFSTRRTRVAKMTREIRNSVTFAAPKALPLPLLQQLTRLGEDGGAEMSNVILAFSFGRPFRGHSMPTSLPIRRVKSRARSSLFLVWALALCGAGIAIEWIDPAPMDVAAAWVVSP